MDEDKLKRFLVELPSALSFRNGSRVHEYVFKVLYFMSTNNGEYLLHLFPDLPPILELDRERLVNSDFTLETLDKLSSLQKPESKEYSHPKTSLALGYLRLETWFIDARSVVSMTRVSCAHIVLMNRIMWVIRS